MPLELTETGFVLTYSRVKCLFLGCSVLVLAATMLAVGSYLFWPIFENAPDTPPTIDRAPAAVIASALLASGAVRAAPGLWNLKQAIWPQPAASIDTTGAESRLFLQQHSIARADIQSGRVVKKTLFIYPDENANPVAIQTLCTSVRTADLKNVLARYRPDIFGDLTQPATV